MAGFDRAEHCRRIASAGGRAVVAKHGAAHMAEIGRLGFRAAVELGWGTVLADKLAAGYLAKFGRPLQLGSASAEKAAARARARKLYAGLPCDLPGCTEKGEVHHIEQFAGAGDPNIGTNIQILCKAHHREEHRRRRRAHLGGKGKGRGNGAKS